MLFFAVFSGCAASQEADQTSSENEEPCVSSGTGLTGLIDPCVDIGDATGKPVIYLYPEKQMAVEVALAYKGLITTEYPKSENGIWKVWADPSGVIKVKNRTYNYLFWEGYSPLTATFDFSEGFVVAREDYIPFLEEKLTLLGLNEGEQDDFITYWLPQMQENEWSKIRFLYEEYEDMAKVTVIPRPDTFIRVFMIVAEANESTQLPEQTLEPVIRQGFTVVEWGGSYLKR